MEGVKRQPWRKRHKGWFRALLVMLLVLVYEVGGACLPFAFHPEVSETYRSAWDRSAFYADSSPDRAALVTDNQDALDVRLRLISEARERLIFSTFEIRADESGRDVLCALLNAADRGVRVELLCDGMNGLKNMTLSPEFWALGTHPNAEIRWYNTPNPLAPWTFNGRLHDKYIIVDDRLLLLGGRNTFDYFIGEYAPASLRSHDLDVLLFNTAAGTGAAGESALFQVEEYFYRVWDGPDAKARLTGAPPGLGGGVNAAGEALRRRWADMVSARPGLIAPGAVDYEAVTVPARGVRLITNPIHIFAKEPTAWWQMMALLGGAEESAYLQTPYAVLNAPMYEALEALARSPIDMTLQLNSIAVGDNVMASSDYTLHRPDVIATGVTLYEYFGDYSSHGKSALVDDDLALVGSYNLDLRSTYLDTELMLAVHSEPFAAILAGHLEEMEAQALRVNPDGSYQPRPGVEEKQVQPPRSYIYPVSSLLVQLIRNLL